MMCECGFFVLAVTQNLLNKMNACNNTRICADKTSDYMCTGVDLCSTNNKLYKQERIKNKNVLELKNTLLIVRGTKSI